MADTVSIIGYERALIDGLATAIHRAARTRHDFSDLRETVRGATFDVRLVDADGHDAGVARVSIEYLRHSEIASR